jgi:hypothetical protein
MLKNEFVKEHFDALAEVAEDTLIICSEKETDRCTIVAQASPNFLYNCCLQIMDHLSKEHKLSLGIELIGKLND